MENRDLARFKYLYNLVRKQLLFFFSPGACCERVFVCRLFPPPWEQVGVFQTKITDVRVGWKGKGAG